MKDPIEIKMDLIRETTEALGSELFQKLFTVEGERDNLLALLSLPKTRVILETGEWVTYDSDTGLFTLHELTDGYPFKDAGLTIQQLLEKVVQDE